MVWKTMMTMASSQHCQHKENQGFKLLEEDNLDDRPCSAVKKFVASVLNKKDIKDQDVASSYRNLVEYRDARRSPTHGPHPATEGEDLGPLPLRSSPSPPAAASKEREERLPNKLLDELYEDIGMKSGDQEELDFVEFLMGQAAPPQHFLTAEGVAGSGGGGGCEHGGGSGGNVSAASSNISTPSNGSGSGGFLSGGDWLNLAHMSCGAGAAAAGGNTGVSSSSNSPDRKRIHLSTSEQNSPVQLQQLGQEQQQLKQQQQQQKQQSQLYHQHVSRSVPSPRYVGQDMKKPPTPVTPAVCDIPVQQSSGRGMDSATNAGVNMPLAKERGFTPRHTPAVSERLDSASCGSVGQGSGISAHVHLSSYQNCTSGTMNYSHASRASHPLPASSHLPLSADHTPQRVKGPGETSTTMSHHQHQHQHQHQHYSHHQQYQQTPQAGHSGMGTPQHHPQMSKGRLYHKPCKQPSPAVHADNALHVRWKFPEVTSPVKKHHPPTPLPNQLHQHDRETRKSAFSHPQERTQSGDSGHSVSNVPSVSSENRNTACASSVSLPSVMTSTKRGMCESTSQTVHSDILDHTAYLGGPHHLGSLDSQTQGPAVSKDPQFYRDHSHNDVPADSSTVKSYTQLREPRSDFYQPSQSRSEPYTISTNCAPADSSTLNSSGFISHSSYPVKPSTGLNTMPGNTMPGPGSSYSRGSSCDFEASVQSVQMVKKCEQVNYANNPQCNTNSSVLPNTGRAVQTGLHGNTHTHTHFEGAQGVGRSQHNSSQTMASFSDPNVSTIDSKSYGLTNSYAANTGANPPTSLPVNHMRAALQQGEAPFSGNSMTNQHHLQHQGWRKSATPHQQANQQHGVDGLDKNSQQTNLRADLSQSMYQQPGASLPPAALDSYTAQSDLNLHAAMNCRHDMSMPPDRTLGMNVGQNIHPGTSSQNLNTSCRHDMSASGRGVSPRDQMLPPPSPSPVGFQPSAVSTPVSDGRHKARPPSHGHRVYESMPECPEQTVDGQIPAGPDGSGAVSHRYQAGTYPAGGTYPPSWAGPSDPSVASDYRPHPVRMTSPHMGQMQPTPYPHTPQSQQFVSSQPGHPGPSQSPSSCLHRQSQQTGPCLPTETQLPYPPHPIPAHPPASFHPIDSQGLSISQHMQPQQLGVLQSQQFSHPTGPNQRFPPPQAALYPNADPSLHASYPHINNPTSSGSNYIGPASKTFSAKQKFLQNLILDNRNAAYRSHPLFPLLRDLVIAGMSFDHPRFHYQQLLSMLPREFDKLQQNFLQRNPPAGDYQGNFAVESVLMDSLRLAHASLVEKIDARQAQEQTQVMSSSSMQAVNDFCSKFDQMPVGGMGPGNGMTNGYPPAMGLQGQPGDMMMQPPLHIMTPVGGQAKFMVTLNEGEIMTPVMLQTLNDTGDIVYSGTPKQESKKHPSLPKEAVTRMMSWLKAHKDNPYPNDEEKTTLIKQTGLTMNQINYWFTNARRRILPKWSRSGDSSS